MEEDNRFLRLGTVRSVPVADLRMGGARREGCEKSRGEVGKPSMLGIVLEAMRY